MRIGRVVRRLWRVARVWYVAGDAARVLGARRAAIGSSRASFAGLCPRRGTIRETGRVLAAGRSGVMYVARWISCRVGSGTGGAGGAAKRMPEILVRSMRDPSMTHMAGHPTNPTPPIDLPRSCTHPTHIPPSLASSRTRFTSQMPWPWVPTLCNHRVAHIHHVYPTYKKKRKKGKSLYARAPPPGKRKPVPTVPYP